MIPPKSLRLLKEMLCYDCEEFRGVLRSVSIEKSSLAAPVRHQQRLILFSHYLFPPSGKFGRHERRCAVRHSIQIIEDMGELVKHRIVPHSRCGTRSAYAVPCQQHRPPAPRLAYLRKVDIVSSPIRT